MKTLGNIIWVVFGGFFAALGLFLIGIILCITIIGIPAGVVSFKLSKVMLWPFGKEVHINFDEHPIGNILWLIFVGWEQCVTYLIAGIIFCITIIGIPFGKQWFKLAKLVLLPFGATITE